MRRLLTFIQIRKEQSTTKIHNQEESQADAKMMWKGLVILLPVIIFVAVDGATAQQRVQHLYTWSLGKVNECKALAVSTVKTQCIPRDLLTHLAQAEQGLSMVEFDLKQSYPGRPGIWCPALPPLPGKCNAERLAGLLEELTEAQGQLNNAWRGLKQGKGSANDYNNVLVLLEIFKCKIGRIIKCLGDYDDGACFGSKPTDTKTRSAAAANFFKNKTPSAAASGKPGRGAATAVEDPDVKARLESFFTDGRKAVVRASFLSEELAAILARQKIPADLKASLETSFNTFNETEALLERAAIAVLNDYTDLNNIGLIRATFQDRIIAGEDIETVFAQLPEDIKSLPEVKGAYDDFVKAEDDVLQLGELIHSFFDGIRDLPQTIERRNQLFSIVQDLIADDEILLNQSLELLEKIRSQSKKPVPPSLLTEFQEVVNLRRKNDQDAVDSLDPRDRFSLRQLALIKRRLGEFSEARYALRNILIKMGQYVDEDLATEINNLRVRVDYEDGEVVRALNLLSVVFGDLTKLRQQYPRLIPQ